MDSFNMKKENKAMAGRTQVLPGGRAGTVFIRDRDVCYGAMQNQS